MLDCLLNHVFDSFVEEFVLLGNWDTMHKKQYILYKNGQFSGNCSFIGQYEGSRMYYHLRAFLF